MANRISAQESGGDLSMVVVMGVTGSGKSYFINRIAGRQAVAESDGLDSCTQQCALVPVEIGNSKVLLIDTPGFDDTKRTDSEILDEIARILSAQYQLGVQLKGVIYIHRITDIRYARSSVKTFEVFKKMCGEQALKNVLLVTSRWAEVEPALGPQRERELKDKFWAYMLERGSNTSRFHGDRDSAVALVSQLLAMDTTILELQKELVDDQKTLDQTSAGSYVSNDLQKMKENYEKELASLEKLRQELLDSDRAMKRQIQKDWAEEQERLRRTEEQQDILRRPVSREVEEQIEKASRKKGGLSKVLPFVPFALSMLGQFVGIPPGFLDILTSWFVGGDFGDFSDLFNFF